MNKFVSEFEPYLSRLGLSPVAASFIPRLNHLSNKKSLFAELVKGH